MFNMLSIPREKVQLGDIYRLGRNDEKLYPSTNIKNFVTSEFKMPFIEQPETLADVSGTLSGSVESKLGLDLLENFLNVLSSLNLGTSIRAKYESRGTYYLRFQFTGATREHLDPFLFGDSLKNHNVKTDNPAFYPSYRYFVGMGVIRTNSISIVAENERNKKFDVGINAASIATISGGIELVTSEQGVITYKNPNKQLAIGIELCELHYDSENNQFKIAEVDDYFIVREGGKEVTYRRLTAPRSYMGDAMNGYLFIEIAEEQKNQ
jgi:hypothetical protein